MFEKLLERITGKLKKLKISYMVIGGQAVLLYGEPRLTKDIDITLGVDVDSLSAVENMAAKANLKPLVENASEFVNKTYVYPCEDKNSGIRIDFIFSNSLYEKTAIKRARKIKIGKSFIKFASPEDIIIHKIIAGRPVDMKDAENISLKQRKLNRDYILRWLKKFEIILNKNLTQTFKNMLSS